MNCVDGKPYVHNCFCFLQLNETVYRAYQPRPEEKPELELVFFHGIQFQDCKEPHATTWMTRDNSECWLQTLLVEAFPRARIFTVSYDSSAAKTSKVGRMGMYLTGENLLSDLTADEVGLGQAGCPVVLVGHCLGGLVLKEICLFAEKACRRKTGKPLEQRARALYSNLRGMFFYGTPHTGSMVGDMLQDCFKSVGALSEEIETLQASSTRRNESFMELKSENKWFLYGIGESMETYVVSYIDLVPILLVLPSGLPFYFLAMSYLPLLCLIEWEISEQSSLSAWLLIVDLV